jgi:hypothetical protein
VNFIDEGHASVQESIKFERASKHPMKHRLPLSLSLFGAALLITGIAFKLNHVMGAVELSNTGFILLVVGLIWLTVSVLRKN